MIRTLAVRSLLALWFCAAALNQSKAAVFQLNSSGDIAAPTILDFDSYADLTAADTLFPGIRFSRDDGQPVFVYDWTDIGRSTISADNVLGTLAGPYESTWSSQLNVVLEKPVYEFGAYFGNDQTLRMFPPTDFFKMRLSAYDALGQCLGSVDLMANHNTAVDQFIGIGSDSPISQLRFENLSASSAASKYYSVVLDNMMFTPSPTSSVPEPSLSALLGLGLLVLLKRRKA
jgi:PEP-CTERM motif